MKACGGAVFPVVVNMIAGPRADKYVNLEGALTSSRVLDASRLLGETEGLRTARDCEEGID